MDTRWFLIISSSLLAVLFLCMAHGKIEWAKKEQNPGGERDIKMKARLKFLGYLFLGNVALQILIVLNEI